MALQTCPEELTFEKTENQVASLINQLSRQNWLYRAKAAMSLREFTSQPTVRTALMKALKDTHFLVRCHAADALKQVKSPETEAALKQWEAEETKAAQAEQLSQSGLR